ncbi:MAG: glycosyltransferase family 2 protein [Eubacteriales bacterium]
MKKVSLILTTFNSKKNFEQTLRSIDEQTYGNIEVIIIDGASVDGTLDIIKEYAEVTEPNTKWLSEPDNGIYDAINKGIRLATGDYIEIMNDRYVVNSAIEELVNAIELNQGVVGAHADIVYEADSRVIRKWKMGEGAIYRGWMPGHPSLLLKKSIYDEYGLYDISYTCAADYEFMLRFLIDKNLVAYVPKTLISMFYGGTSTATLGSYVISFREAYRALRKNRVQMPFAICIIRTVRVLMQFI